MARMRDKLIELIDNAGIQINGNVTPYRDYGIENLADYILEDGWIRPPCKVGDVVYQVDTLFEEVVATKLKVVELTIDNKGIKTLYGATSMGSIYCFDRGYNLDQIKFTKEEAEQALRKEQEK